MRRRWTIVALLVVAVAAALVVSMWLSEGSRDDDAPLVGYRLGVSDRELVLVVEVGPEDTVLPAKVTIQNETKVQVAVKASRAPGINPGRAVQKSVSVQLDAALGVREVVGPTGRVLTRLQ